MAGLKSGVAKQLLDEEPRAIHTHCYGHALNLARGDAVKNFKLMKDALETTREITKLIKKSPRRDACFERLKTETAPSHTGNKNAVPYSIDRSSSRFA